MANERILGYRVLTNLAKSQRWFCKTQKLSKGLWFVWDNCKGRTVLARVWSHFLVEGGAKERLCRTTKYIHGGWVVAWQGIYGLVRTFLTYFWFLVLEDSSLSWLVVESTLFGCSREVQHFADCSFFYKIGTKKVLFIYSFIQNRSWVSFECYGKLLILIIHSLR